MHTFTHVHFFACIWAIIYLGGNIEAPAEQGLENISSISHLTKSEGEWWLLRVETFSHDQRASLPLHKLVPSYLNLHPLLQHIPLTSPKLSSLINTQLYSSNDVNFAILRMYDLNTIQLPSSVGKLTENFISCFNITQFIDFVIINVCYN